MNKVSTLKKQCITVYLYYIILFKIIYALIYLIRKAHFFLFFLTAMLPYNNNYNNHEKIRNYAS